jgi:uncharacterized delta-60 repeat protein
MQNKVKFKNILFTIAISTGLVLGAYIIYNRNIDINKTNIESVNKVEDIKVKDKKEDNKIDRDIEDRNNAIEARESEEVRENRVATIVDNIRGEYRAIRRQPLRYNPIEVYKPPITNNNNNPIELPSIPNTPDIPSVPVSPIIPTIPNPPVIPPDTDNGDGNDIDSPTDPGEDNGGDDNAPILVAGDRDPSFDTGVPVGFDDEVNAIAIQSDGKIIVGGYFSSYQGVAANNITRLNTDGSIDTSFNIGSGFNNDVYTLAIQSDGKIIVGGEFSSYQGVASNRIARLNIDGSIDNSFNIGTGFDSGVNIIKTQVDGKILVGGYFRNYQEVASNRIARLNSDGSRDTSFNIGTGFNNIVETLAIQEDGKILVGGWFTSYQGVASNRIVRLNIDGSIDTNFNIGTGFNNVLETLAIQDDGKIIVGGYFTSYQGVASNRIIRLNTDGSRDTGFNIGTGFDWTVNTLSIQSDGKIIVGGGFSSYQAVEANYIVRLNSDGSRDTSFNIGTGFNGLDVRTLTIQSDGKIIVDILLAISRGLGANSIVRLNIDGSIDTSFNNIGTGFSSTVKTLAIQSDGKIIVVGDFSSYQGVASNRIARLNIDGSIDTSFNIGIGFNNDVYTLALQSDGKIIVGGDFSSYQGVGVNNIIRLNTDGSIDNSFNIGTGFDDYVNTIAIQSDGKIIVGGWFSSYQGVGANNIVRLNSDGSIDNSFNIGTGFDDYVNTIAIQSDGKIIVGGWFSSYQGVGANNIVRLNSDGSIDNSFNIGAGFDWDVNTIAIQSDGKIIVGGWFESYQGVGANRIIRLNTDGSIDTNFNIGTGFDSDVYTLAIQSDGKIVVGGYFSRYRDQIANVLIRINN